jgi:hypothetical protein
MNKTVLITGASSGIGAELAKEFAARGYNLVLVARTADRLNSLALELHSRYRVSTKVIVSDLSDRDSANIIYRELRKENTAVDILVNNAGFNVYGAFVDTDLEKELQMIQVMVTSLTHLTKLFVKDMIAKGSGRILNIGSTGSFVPGPFDAVYQASKAYILSFSEAINEELRGTGVTVTALCPGVTETEFAKRANMTGTRLFKGKAMSAASVARIGFRAVMKGKRSVVAGFMNKVLVLSIRFSPKGMLLRFARYLLSEP